MEHTALPRPIDALTLLHVSLRNSFALYLGSHFLVCMLKITCHVCTILFYTIVCDLKLFICVRVCLVPATVQSTVC